MFVSQLIKLISSVMLISGTLKRNHMHLIPWLFGEGVAMFILVSLTIIGFFVFPRPAILLLCLITGMLQLLKNNITFFKL